MTQALVIIWNWQMVTIFRLLYLHQYTIHFKVTYFDSWHQSNLRASENFYLSGAIQIWKDPGWICHNGGLGQFHFHCLFIPKKKHNGTMRAVIALSVDQFCVPMGTRGCMLPGESRWNQEWTSPMIWGKLCSRQSTINGCKLQPGTFTFTVTNFWGWQKDVLIN